MASANYNCIEIDHDSAQRRFIKHKSVLGDYFAKAQKEGLKVFESLVAEGEKFQERTKVAADERLAELREKATGTWDKLEKVFEDRVARALHSLNVPSRHDIDTLSKRVHELTVITKKLAEEEEIHGRGRPHRAKAE